MDEIDSQWESTEDTDVCSSALEVAYEFAFGRRTIVLGVSPQMSIETDLKQIQLEIS